MKSFDREFLERQAVPLEFAGILRLLGEYKGKLKVLATGRGATWQKT